MRSPLGVCIIDENMAVPPDRRVWREAKALQQAGYSVSVICPKRPGYERSHETIDGVEIYRHRTSEGSGFFGHLLEYAWALAAEFLLAIRIFVRNGFCILQACNPPDTIFLIALVLKPFGVKFIYDQHDPVPELYLARYHRKGVFHWMLRLAESLTFRAADVAIATNDSCREIALTRGGVPPEHSVIVRSCPDLNDFPPRPPQPALKQGLKYLVVYVGVMEPQDGCELLLECIDYLVNRAGRRDTLFALIGHGSEVPRLRKSVSTRGLDPWVQFTGALYGDNLRAYLATADVGVAPDPYNDFNDKLTMLKILEYMVYGIPVVLYDLTEGRRSAGAAALYAKANDPTHFAEQIGQLLASPQLRSELGLVGRKRIEDGLNWQSEQLALLRAYERAIHGHVLEPSKQISAGTISPAD